MDHSNKPLMLRVIASAVSIASRAGAEVRRITKSGQLDVIDKGVQDFQTEADRTAQRMIVASLSKKFPKCTIVGEEDLVEDKEADSNLLVLDQDETVLSKRISVPNEFKDIKEEDLTIWVDPLDGTTEFVKGLLEHVTVLIGISVKGQSVAGVIHQPFYGYSKCKKPDELSGRTLWGLVGVGCFGNEATYDLLDQDLVITTTASHGNKNIEDALKALQPDKVLKVGGAGHKVLLVLEGKAHSYVFTSNGCKRWDTSAPEAILKSLGGSLTDVFGDQVDYSFRKDGDYQNYLGIVASISPSVHKRIIEGIPSEIKDRLKIFQEENFKSKI